MNGNDSYREDNDVVQNGWWIPAKLHIWRVLGTLKLAIFWLTVSMGADHPVWAADDLHITAEAELFHLHLYPTLKKHKAIAVGPGQIWAATYRHGTAKLAKDAAIQLCQKRLKASSSPSISKSKCVLFDLDGVATGEAPPIGVPFGTVLPEPDLPFIRGGAWPASTPKARGTMILVHGCNRSPIDTGWLYAWVSYYQAIGFRVFAPDSFAEDRPPELCGSPGEHGINQLITIRKLRVAQTRRTIARVRKLYPEDPIYLHGHSGGGNVVQALGEKVGGIIVTGAPCGFGRSGLYNTPKGVPTLVILGSKDPYEPMGKTQKSFSRACKDIWGKGSLRVVSVPKMGHFAAPWWPGVMHELSRFLKAKDITIRRRKESQSKPAEFGISLDKYFAAELHRALAGRDRNMWRWDSGYESPGDAEEAALFSCDAALGVNPYAQSDPAHQCDLWDVDGLR